MHKPAGSFQVTVDRSEIRSFKDLVVWQRAMELAAEVYQLTKTLPASEQHGLISQMRRCAVSIPSNIAEGKQRGSRKDFTQFLRIADGSASELGTQLLLAARLFPIRGTERCQRLLSEVQRMIGGMIKKLNLPAASRKPQTSNLYA